MLQEGVNDRVARNMIDAETQMALLIDILRLLVLAIETLAAVAVGAMLTLMLQDGKSKPPPVPARRANLFSLDEYRRKALAGR